jgi:hypothetical protein
MATRRWALTPLEAQISRARPGDDDRRVLRGARRGQRLGAGAGPRRGHRLRAGCLAIPVRVAPRVLHLRQLAGPAWTLGAWPAIAAPGAGTPPGQRTAHRLAAAHPVPGLHPALTCGPPLGTSGKRPGTPIPGQPGANTRPALPGSAPPCFPLRTQNWTVCPLSAARNNSAVPAHTRRSACLQALRNPGRAHMA